MAKLTEEQQAYYQQLAQAEMEAAARQREQTQQEISQSRQMQQAPQPRNGENVPQPRQVGQYTNMAGISDNSRASLNYYGQGYQPSETVTQAQQYLNDVLSKQPGQYNNSYAGQIENLYNQIMGRPKFVYDVNKDPLFKSYKDQYMINGQRAMQDTVGNAAALTGGYGNSWGTTAGYQAYQQYLQALNGVIPDLEQRAFERWGAEGDQMRDNLSLALTLEGRDYDRYRDTVGDWRNDRDYARGAYDTEIERDQREWQNMLNYYLNQAQLEQNDYWNQMQYLQALGGGSGGGGGGYNWPEVQKQAADYAYRIAMPLGENNGGYAQLPGGWSNRPLTADEIKGLIQAGGNLEGARPGTSRTKMIADQQAYQAYTKALKDAEEAKNSGDAKAYTRAMNQAQSAKTGQNALQLAQAGQSTIGQEKNKTEYDKERERKYREFGMDSREYDF